MKTLRDYINLIETAQQGVAEAEKNPHTSALGKALYRDLSKEKKASPQQVQRNRERWAKRQAEHEQGVVAGSELTVQQHKSPYEGAEVGEYTTMFKASPNSAQRFAKHIISKGGKVRIGRRGQDYYVYHNIPMSKEDWRKSEQQGMAEGAPIVVMPSSERLKKAEPTKVRYRGDIVPPAQPPSTEKRGVKGRPGQRPMPRGKD